MRVMDVVVPGIAPKDALEMSGTRALVKRGPEGGEPPPCPHVVFQPQRQSCHCCGAQDHIDFRVSDRAWAAIIPERLRTANVCLRCFDAFAAETGVAYAKDLTEVCFVGDRGSFTFVPRSALDLEEWHRG